MLYAKGLVDACGVLGLVLGCFMAGGWLKYRGRFAFWARCAWRVLFVVGALGVARRENGLWIGVRDLFTPMY
jgi:hypothetical protein